MSRRPRRNRPPRLDLPPAPAGAPSSSPGPATTGAALRRALLRSRVTGPHARLGRAAVRHAVRALASGDPRAGLGCDDLDGATMDEIEAALTKTHGVDLAGPRIAIDPDATLAAARAATARLREAAAAGARVAVATSRPASLLALAQWVAGDVADRGARVLVADRAAVEATRSRELWWVGDVAVVTDGQALLADDGVAAASDWLFAVGPTDLVVADRGFAGVALGAGCEVIAWADLDAPALALAATRGRPITVVPIDEQRPAAAYDALIAALDDGPASSEPD